MSKFVAGVIGWSLSIVWSATVFMVGMVCGMSAYEYKMEKENHEGGLHEV